MKTIRPAERRSLFLSTAPAKKAITAKPQPQQRRPQVEQTPPCKPQAKRGGLFLSTAPTKKKSIKPAGKPKQQAQPRRKQKRQEVEQLPPRKRPCPSGESSLINIYTPLSPELFSFPTLPVLSADDDTQTTTTETVDTAQLQQLLMDEEIRLVRMLCDAKREELRQIQAAQLELQSRSLMDNMLSTTGIRRVVNDCVFEPMYK